MPSLRWHGSRVDYWQLGTDPLEDSRLGANVIPPGGEAAGAFGGARAVAQRPATGLLRQALLEHAKLKDPEAPLPAGPRLALMVQAAKKEGPGGRGRRAQGGAAAEDGRHTVRHEGQYQFLLQPKLLSQQYLMLRRSCTTVLGPGT